MESSETESLSQKEKKALRGIAQRLKASVLLGKSGISETVLTEMETALLKEELVKVKFVKDRKVMTEQVADLETKTRSICVSRVGFSATFYRPKQQKAEA
ncbi:MAG: YhbY family RNA-binding protein [Opitutales bacterium]